MIEYPTMEENPPQRVRAGQKYIFRRSGMDTIWSEHCPNIHDGTPVVVTQLPSSPKPGTMGQVHISDLNGNFLGMCSMHSLMTQTDELERSGQVKMVKHNPAERERIAVGDVVKYARHFLQSTGMYTGAIPFAEGQVTSIRQGIASINWNTEEAPSRVNIVNLVRKDRLHLESNPGDIHIDIGSHNENPPDVVTPHEARSFVRRWLQATGIEDKIKIISAKTISFQDLARGSIVQVKISGIMQESTWFELKRDAKRFGFLVHWTDEGYGANPPLEILSDKMSGRNRVVDYRVTVSMQGPKDAEKILHTLYPKWRVISHSSLREGVYPGIRHAYSVTMAIRHGKNPPLNKTMERWNRHAVALLMRLPGVKYAEVGRMGTAEWFFDIEDVNGRHVRREFPTQADLAVAIGNLIERVKEQPRQRLSGNPPLPASALMDIATAKTTAHEVEEGQRPLGNLGTVDHLLDRGLQKLRGSHLGNVDWQNPPMQRSDAVQIVEEIYDELDFLLNELHQKKVLASDQHHLFVRVMGRLNRLKHAINNKWIVNPGPGRIQRYKTRHPQTAVEIYKDIVEIKAIKRDGKRYVHKFGKGSHILGLPDGSILIESRKGKRLWKNFKAGG